MVRVRMGLGLLVVAIVAGCEATPAGSCNRAEQLYEDSLDGKIDSVDELRDRVDDLIFDSDSIAGRAVERLKEHIRDSDESAAADQVGFLYELCADRG